MNPSAATPDGPFVIGERDFMKGMLVAALFLGLSLVAACRGGTSPTEGEAVQSGRATVDGGTHASPLAWLPVEVGQQWLEARSELRRLGANCRRRGAGAETLLACEVPLDGPPGGVTSVHIETHDGVLVSAVTAWSVTERPARGCNAWLRDLASKHGWPSPTYHTEDSVLEVSSVGNDLAFSVACTADRFMNARVSDSWLHLPTGRTSLVFPGTDVVTSNLLSSLSEEAGMRAALATVEADGNFDLARAASKAQEVASATLRSLPVDRLSDRSRAALDRFKATVEDDRWFRPAFELEVLRSLRSLRREEAGRERLPFGFSSGQPLTDFASAELNCWEGHGSTTCDGTELLWTDEMMFLSEKPLKLMRTRLFFTNKRLHNLEVQGTARSCGEAVAVLQEHASRLAKAGASLVHREGDSTICKHGQKGLSEAYWRNGWLYEFQAVPSAQEGLVSVKAGPTHLSRLEAAQMLAMAGDY